MGEKIEKKYYNEKTWALDCKLALIQQLIWLLFAMIALAGAWLIMHFMPADSSAYGVMALALVLMACYQWAARAPRRALNGWIIRYRQEMADPEEVLAFLDALEKKLPVMKKKEMAFTLTDVRAVMLFKTGAQQEAIELLENFDRCWDESQRQRIKENIRIMKEKMGLSPQEKEENPCEQ